MNVRIRIRRTVVQDKFLAARTGLKHLFIKPHFLPFLQTRRLRETKIRLLSKIRPGKVNSFL